jgi:hypothetical protein
LNYIIVIKMLISFSIMWEMVKMKITWSTITLKSYKKKKQNKSE